MGDEPKRWLRAWTWCLAFTLLFLVIYPLSMGPVVWLALESRDPRTNVRALSKAYAPIGWLHRRSKTVGAVINWYMSLWRHG